MFRFIIFFFIVLASSAAFCDTIQLTDGRTIKGEVVEKNAYQIVVRDEKGAMQRFYKEQVANIIEGEVRAPVSIDADQFENISAQKVELIIRLLEANGTRKNLQKNIEGTIQAAPPSRKEAMKDLFDIEEIITALIPIYDRYFQEQELAALVKFYESPVGQKLINTSPEIIKEATQASLNYFQKKLIQ